MAFKNAEITTLSFFAAANGYGGFRSYFMEIFNPASFVSMHILKGGPGTGKSSFMKRLLHEFKESADECEAIYCSSDPTSLDGVIIKKDGALAAVIDGTAPHAQDPVFPGAVDRIINLGELWNEETLFEARDEIRGLVTAKMHAYGCAYDYLNVAGLLTKKVDQAINSIYNGEDQSKISLLLPEIKNRETRISTRLVTSYGKDGFGRLDTLSRIADEVYSVVGVYGSEYIFMSRLRRALENVGCGFTHLPSVLDGSKTYGIFIPSIKRAIIADRFPALADDSVIDTSRFLDQKRLSEQKECLEFLWREREAMLWAAADQFKRASDEHFKLEKIYSRAMDFSKIDAFYDSCRSDIKKKLRL